MLKRITENPYLDLFSGLVLLMTSAYQTITTLGHAGLGVHHGILVFSIVQIIKAVPEITRGLSELEKANEIFEKHQ